MDKLAEALFVQTKSYAQEYRESRNRYGVCAGNTTEAKLKFNAFYDFLISQGLEEDYLKWAEKWEIKNQEVVS